MGKKTKFLMLAVLALMIAAPLFASAQGLIPCKGTKADPCTLCHLFLLGQIISNFFMWTIAPILAVLVFSWGGFKILISGANPGLRQEGIRAIRNGIIGLLIVFSAWVIVNEFLLFFTKGVLGTGTAQVTSLNPWTDISCPSVIPPTEVAPAEVVTADIVPIPPEVAVKPTNACSGTPPCKVHKDLAVKLLALDAKPLDPWQVTEAYPPFAKHQASCHNTGTCVDINFTAGGTASITQIDSFISAASEAGLRAVYEVSSDSAKNQLLLQAQQLGISLPGGSIITATITAPHFSVYMK